jgi:Family of unknown function (DUF5519)
VDNAVQTLSAQIRETVSSWPDVTVESHRGGMIFFHVGCREIGHLHGNRFADLPFPVRIRKELVAAGKANPHYLHPKSGWVTRYIRGEDDLEAVVELFRLNYGRPWLGCHNSGDWDLRSEILNDDRRLKSGIGTRDL